MLLLLLLLVLASCQSDIFAPTASEIKRAIQLQTPWEGWGFQARHEKEVRLFCIGGSNTIDDMYFVPLSVYIKNTTLHPTWNGTIDRLAISGCSPQDFIGMKYKFESLKHHLWPNMIMLEFSVNTVLADFPTAAHSLDSVIRTFKYKYHHAGLPEPDFLLFELFGVGDVVYESSDKSIPPKELTYKFQRLTGEFEPQKTRGNGMFTGCPSCPELRKVADFYDYPIVSWRYPGFRAFLRWYLQPNQSFVDNPWIFTRDGFHISDFGGQYVTDRLFSAFFRDALEPRTELPYHQRYTLPLELRMFPPVNRSFQVISHTMWNTDEALNLRSKLRQPTTHWSVIQREEHIDGFYHGNECVGSDTPQSVMNMDFEVPLECNRMKTCNVSLGFVKSWNTEKYGNVSCSLIRQDSRRVVAPILFVNATRGEIDHTGILQSVFVGSVPAGKYTVECKKLDAKLSCLAMLSVVADVLL